MMASRRSLQVQPDYGYGNAVLDTSRRLGIGLRIHATRADYEEAQLIQKSPTQDTIMLIMYPRGKTLQTQEVKPRH